MAAQGLNDQGKTVFYKGQEVKRIEFACPLIRTPLGDIEMLYACGKARAYINDQRVPIRVANRIMLEKFGPGTGAVSFPKPGTRLGYWDRSVAGKGKWVSLL
jgi:hypothetical protein